MIWKKLFNDPHEESEQEREKGPERAEEPPVSLHGEDRGVITSEPGEGRTESGHHFADINIRIRIDDENQAGRAALVLASTTTAESEEMCKRELASLSWKSVATEVGGLAGELPQKVTRALVGASLNAGVVEKKRNEMHALMHAAQEALSGFLAVGMLEASVGAKIAIVRNTKWIAVAVMGDTAYHAVAHHERCGLGIMHI